jgi:hypothetical protein
MASTKRVKCDKEGDGFGGKRDDNKGGGQAMATMVMAMVTAMRWTMAMPMRVAGNKKGNVMVARAIEIATRVVVKQQQQQ